MLIIRKEQMHLLEQGVVGGFEQRMLRHLRAFAPKHFEFLGADGMLGIVRLGFKKAKDLGLTAENTIRFYIELMLQLGSHFDEDPMLPWAGEILNDQTMPNQFDRTDQLHEHLVRYRRDVGGENNVHYYRALRRIRQASLDDLVPSPTSNAEEHFMTKALEIFPEKYAYLGENAVRNLVRLSCDSASDYGLRTNLGATVYCGLAYLLGSGVDRDPQFAWVASVLNDGALSDRETKAARLHAAATTALDRCLT